MGKVLMEKGDEDMRLFSYIYAGDQLIVMYDIDERFHYYLNDHLGSARVVIDSTGAVKDKYKRYYAFGAPDAQTVSTDQAYRYTGKPFDEDGAIDLYYYGARYYDPYLMRFTSVDPMRGKIPGWNPYHYVLNNPMKLVDRNGLWPTEVHDEIIDDGLAGITTKEQRDVLKAASRAVDAFENQSPDKAFMHAMRAEGQSVEDAQTLMMDYINDNIDDFINSGNYESLGKALHPLMDMTSPPHDGFQISKNMITLNPFTLKEWWDHRQDEKASAYTGDRKAWTEAMISGIVSQAQQARRAKKRVIHGYYWRKVYYKDGTVGYENVRSGVKVVYD